MLLVENHPKNPASTPSKREEEPAWACHVSARDRLILERALAKLGGATSARDIRDFSEIVRALREATEEHIPDGRVFFLGANEQGPILGSIISSIGVLTLPSGDIHVARVCGPPSQANVSLLGQL